MGREKLADRHVEMVHPQPDITVSIISSLSDNGEKAGRECDLGSHLRPLNLDIRYVVNCKNLSQITESSGRFLAKVKALSLKSFEL